MYNNILELAEQYFLIEKDENKKQIVKKSLRIFKMSCLLYKLTEENYDINEDEYKITKLLVIYCSIILIKTICIFTETSIR